MAAAPETTTPEPPPLHGTRYGPSALRWALLTALVWGATWLVVGERPSIFWRDAKTVEHLPVAADLVEAEDLPWLREWLPAAEMRQWKTIPLRQYYIPIQSFGDKQTAWRSLAANAPEDVAAATAAKWQELYAGTVFETELISSGITREQALARQVRLEGALHVADSAASEHFAENPTPPPSEAGLRSFYEGNRTLFTLPETFTVRHLFLAAHAGKPEEERARAELAITELAGRVTAGETLESLAAQYSEDEATKPLGGLLPRFSAERMPADFLRLVKTAEPGKVVGPLRTELGYHLLRVEERQPARELTFAEAQPMITQAFQARQREKERARFALATVAGQR